jgi:hypothetical protein
MYSLLKRLRKLTVHKEENLFVNGASGMSRSKLGPYFEILDRKKLIFFLVTNQTEYSVRMNKACR